MITLNYSKKILWFVAGNPKKLQLLELLMLEWIGFNFLRGFSDWNKLKIIQKLVCFLKVFHQYPPQDMGKFEHKKLIMLILSYFLLQFVICTLELNFNIMDAILLTL